MAVNGSSDLHAIIFILYKYEDTFTQIMKNAHETEKGMFFLTEIGLKNEY